MGPGKNNQGCSGFIYETLRASCFLATYFMRKSKSSFKVNRLLQSGDFLKSRNKVVKSYWNRIGRPPGSLSMSIFNFNFGFKSYLEALLIMLPFFLFPLCHAPTTACIALQCALGQCTCKVLVSMLYCPSTCS